VNHWRAIAIAACEQCGRNRLPELAAPVTLAQLLGGEAGAATAPGLRLLLSPEASGTLADLKRPVTAVTVLVGPEGGLADEEEHSAVAAGFTAVRLGPRVLRTETAAIAALTLLQRELGDL
jgi:16S rRNA (uracil1498-N3)-methyltransferase